MVQMFRFNADDLVPEELEARWNVLRRLRCPSPSGASNNAPYQKSGRGMRTGLQVIKRRASRRFV